MNGILGHIRRDGHDIQAQLRLTTHGIHVAQGIGSCDLAKQIGVIRNGRKKIHRLHQCQLIRDFIDRCVIALIKAHQQVGIVMDPDAIQQLSQDSGTHLGTTSGTLRQLCQFHFIFSHVVSPSHTVFNAPVKSKIASNTPPPTASALSLAQ